MVGILLTQGLANGALSSKSISHLYSLGFGTVNSESIIVMNLTGASGLIATVLIANSPQVLLSFLYLLYNNLFTCMLSAKEWSGFAQYRQTLRVSSPTGMQRSTYFLQLPYIYSIPLLVASGLFHWLVSQSIFLARVTVYDESGLEDTAQSISTCGYSNIAIIFDLIFGFSLIFIGLGNGFRRYDSSMPLVGSCSAAISAACHPPEGDMKASQKEVKWGALSHEENEDEEGPFGHCCVTSFDVQAPREGTPYAGFSKWSMVTRIKAD